MYSPKITDVNLIRRLYRLGQYRKLPMTHLVKEAISQYLDRYEDKADGSTHTINHPITTKPDK